jgi:hypothetical protein
LIAINSLSSVVEAYGLFCLVCIQEQIGSF